MCYHAQFGHSALKGVGISRGNPTKLGHAGALPLGAGVGGATPYKHISCMWVTVPNLITVRRMVGVY